MKNPHKLANFSYDEYMKSFYELYEHSPWVIENAYKIVKENSMYEDIGKFHELLSQIVLDASKNLQDSLIKAHPMLAGEKAMKNELTDFSKHEQKSAGFDNCSEKEIDRFNQLNQAYFEKFSFPFIIAVKGKTKDEILKIFTQRLENSIEDEHFTALTQINQIGLIRIKGIYE
jgi:2-oxo-4-hydroxy-4-carboxy-5-ureidoimidazoline decarboxylase